jgi:hypothetical protein
MNIKCHHCKKEIEAVEFISISANMLRIGSPGAQTTGSLYFHVRCFEQIAGTEYITDLIDVIHKEEMEKVFKPLHQQAPAYPCINCGAVRTSPGLCSRCAQKHAQYQSPVYKFDFDDLKIKIPDQDEWDMMIKKTKP